MTPSPLGNFPARASGCPKKKLALGAIARDGEVRLMMKAGRPKPHTGNSSKDVVGDDAE
jgi:hypothetical protein